MYYIHELYSEGVLFYLIVSPTTSDVIWVEEKAAACFDNSSPCSDNSSPCSGSSSLFSESSAAAEKQCGRL